MKQLGLHLAVRCLVEGVHGRLDDVRGKCRIRIGLQTPVDRRPGVGRGHGEH